MCFEVHLIENEKVDLPDEKSPCVARVGWSIDGSDYQLGEDKFSWGYGGSGKSSTDSKFRHYGKPFGAGDVITCFVDLETVPKAMFFALNGTYLGVAFRFTNELDGKVLYPHICVKNVKYEVNFGGKPPKHNLTNGFVMIQSIPEADLTKPPPGPTKPEDAEIIMMVGLPGSGKSYWCENYAKQHKEKKFYILGTNIIIDRMKVFNLVRKRNYHGRWEELIKRASAVLNKLFKVAQKSPRNYILDQTNVYFTARQRKMESFKGYKRIAAVVVNKPDVLKYRTDKQRQVEGKIIPDEAIDEMKKNFTLPEVGPSFDHVWYLEEPLHESRDIIQAARKEAQRGKRPSDNDQTNKSFESKRPRAEQSSSSTRRAVDSEIKSEPPDNNRRSDNRSINSQDRRTADFKSTTRSSDYSSSREMRPADRYESSSSGFRDRSYNKDEQPRRDRNSNRDTSRDVREQRVSTKDDRDRDFNIRNQENKFAAPSFRDQNITRVSREGDNRGENRPFDGSPQKFREPRAFQSNDRREARRDDRTLRGSLIEERNAQPFKPRIESAYPDDRYKREEDSIALESRMDPFNSDPISGRPFEDAPVYHKDDRYREPLINQLRPAETRYEDTRKRPYEDLPLANDRYSMRRDEMDMFDRRPEREYREGYGERSRPDYARRPVDAHRDLRPIDAIRDLRPIDAIRDSRPVDAIRDSRQIDSTREPRPMDDIRDPRFFDAIRDLRPINATREPRTIDDIRNSRLMDATREPGSMGVLREPRSFDAIRKPRPFDTTREPRPENVTRRDLHSEDVIRDRPFDAMREQPRFDNMREARFEGRGEEFQREGFDDTHRYARPPDAFTREEKLRYDDTRPQDDEYFARATADTRRDVERRNDGAFPPRHSDDTRDYGRMHDKRYDDDAPRDNVYNERRYDQHQVDSQFDGGQYSRRPKPAFGGRDEDRGEHRGENRGEMFRAPRDEWQTNELPMRHEKYPPRVYQEHEDRNERNPYPRENRERNQFYDSEVNNRQPPRESLLADKDCFETPSNSSYEKARENDFKDRLPFRPTKPYSAGRGRGGINDSFSYSSKTQSTSNHVSSSSYQTQMTTSTANYGHQQRQGPSVVSRGDQPPMRSSERYSMQSRDRYAQDTDHQVPPPKKPSQEDKTGDASYEKQQEDYQKAYSQWYANYAQAFAELSKQKP